MSGLAENVNFQLIDEGMEPLKMCHAVSVKEKDENYAQKGLQCREWLNRRTKKLQKRLQKSEQV
jgi:hypothetical protein